MTAAPQHGHERRDAFCGLGFGGLMPARIGHPGGCVVCAHVERTRIELKLADRHGKGQTAVAREFGVSKDSVHRHWHGHISEARRVSLLFGPVQRMNLSAQLSEESSSLIDHYRAVRAGLYRLYDAAVDAGDRSGASQLAARLISCLDSMARLNGDLAPFVQNNTQVNNFYLAPEFAAFQADLIRALSRFPEARAAVVQEFERLEAAAAAPLPALEHHANAA
jgi:hypothetical protein